MICANPACCAEFRPRHKRQLYCCTRCKDRHRSARRTARLRAQREAAQNGTPRCVTCGTELEGKRKLYCSDRCCDLALNASRRNRPKGIPERVVLANGITARIVVDVVEYGGKQVRLPRPVWEL